ncbi:hypothetical protein RRF57_011274 [Xylaria bambusicola]|uniref:Uncharacterized protein n=1 Tax=Xylaria bambusicola TaxID=326684 RepID=A0AAN7UTJ4_9PEZI
MTYCLHDDNENSVEARIDVIVANSSGNERVSEMFMLRYDGDVGLTNISRAVDDSWGLSIFEFIPIT